MFQRNKSSTSEHNIATTTCLLTFMMSAYNIEAGAPKGAVAQKQMADYADGTMGIDFYEKSVRDTATGAILPPSKRFKASLELINYIIEDGLVLRKRSIPVSRDYISRSQARDDNLREAKRRFALAQLLCARHGPAGDIHCGRALSNGLACQDELDKISQDRQKIYQKAFQQVSDVHNQFRKASSQAPRPQPKVPRNHEAAPSKPSSQKRAVPPSTQQSESRGTKNKFDPFGVRQYLYKPVQVPVQQSFCKKCCGTKNKYKGYNSWGWGLVITQCCATVPYKEYKKSRDV